MNYNQRQRFENFLWLAAGACYVIVAVCLIASGCSKHPKIIEEKLQPCNFEVKQNNGCLPKLGDCNEIIYYNS